MKEPFSLNDFKKWMNSQTDKPTKKSCHRVELVGMQVESKINVKRLVNKMTVDEGDATELAEDFRKHGGIVQDADDDGNLLIEVQTGTFTLHKIFIKKTIDV